MSELDKTIEELEAEVTAELEEVQTHRKKVQLHEKGSKVKVIWKTLVLLW